MCPTAINKWLRVLKEYGLSKEDYEKHRQVFFEKNKFFPTEHDAVWGLFNSLITRISDKNDLKMLYFSMSQFLYEEGRDYMHVGQQAFKIELLSYKDNGIEKVEILSTVDTCDACKKVATTIFSVDNALESMPLPCRNCSFEMEKGKKGWCRCCYIPVVD